MNSIITNLPRYWDTDDSDWQDNLVAGPDYFYDFDQDGDYWNPAAACQPGYGMHIDGEYSGNDSSSHDFTDIAIFWHIDYVTHI